MEVPAITLLLAALAAGLPQEVAWGQDAAAHPETPAFTFLDTNPGRIARPGTPRALGMELLSAIDSAGRVQQGVAIDFAPWSLIPGLAISLSDYQSDLWRFILAADPVHQVGRGAHPDPRQGDQIGVLLHGPAVRFATEPELAIEFEFGVAVRGLRQERCREREQGDADGGEHGRRRGAVSLATSHTHTSTGWAGPGWGLIAGPNLSTFARRRKNGT